MLVNFVSAILPIILGYNWYEGGIVSWVRQMLFCSHKQNSVDVQQLQKVCIVMITVGQCSL